MAADSFKSSSEFRAVLAARRHIGKRIKTKCLEWDLNQLSLDKPGYVMTISL